MAKRDSVAVAESETMASGSSSIVTGPLSASTVTGNSGAAVVSTAADEVGCAGSALSDSPPQPARKRARAARRAARGRWNTFLLPRGQRIWGREAGLLTRGSLFR